MKSSLWKNVRVGSFLVLADEYKGLHRVRVTEIDIKLYEPSAGPGYPSRFSHPYGFTKDTGTVKVVYDSSEEILNLADLIPWQQQVWTDLQRAYKDWQDVKAEAETLQNTFLSMTASLRS